MKKMILILLCLALALSLAACADKEDLRNAQRAAEEHEEELRQEGYRRGYEEGYAEYEAILDYLDKAHRSMENALEIMHSTQQYGGPDTFDDRCDDIIDEITDALSWLEKSYD